MTDTSTASDLEPELERIAEATPGVVHLYQPASIWGVALASVAATDPDVTPAEPSRVILDADGVVSLAIATDNGLSAPDVARAVHDALAAHLIDRSVAFTKIRVTVARID